MPGYHIANDLGDDPVSRMGRKSANDGGPCGGVVHRFAASEPRLKGWGVLSEIMQKACKPRRIPRTEGAAEAPGKKRNTFKVFLQRLPLGFRLPLRRMRVKHFPSPPTQPSI